MRKTTLIGLICTISVCSHARSPIEDFIGNALHRTANISILVKDLKSGKTLHSYRPQNAAIPASTVKVITSATALELLGADYRFGTTLEINGTIAPDSVLHGNLIIYGCGDPTLGSAKLGDALFLNEWLIAVRKAGIKQINGHIIANASAYDTEGVSPKWLWEDMGNYFAAGAYGISYKDNTFEMELRSGDVGTTPEIISITPKIPELTFSNHLQSTSIGFDSAYFYGAPRSDHRSIYGAIPANRARFGVKGDIPRPALLLARDFTRKLKSNGIAVSGDAAETYLSPTTRGKVIYTHLSPKLSEIIKEINHASNNHYAEHLLRHLALSSEKPASSVEALKRIRRFWQSKGISVEGFFPADGSGLSPVNAVSADFLVNVLAYMEQSKNRGLFRASLPTAGQSGGLRHFLKGTVLEGKVKAKSGNINRVRAYTGYIDAGGKRLVFAVIVNNPNSEGTLATRKKVEEFLIAVSR